MSLHLDLISNCGSSSLCFADIIMGTEKEQRLSFIKISFLKEGSKARGPNYSLLGERTTEKLYFQRLKLDWNLDMTAKIGKIFFKVVKVSDAARDSEGHHSFVQAELQTGIL